MRGVNIVIKSIVEGVVVSILVVSASLFMLSFVFGALSLVETEGICDKRDYKIENLYPVRAGCWFWTKN